MVEDPADPGRYDREPVVILDDWTDGVGHSPDRIFEDLNVAARPVWTWVKAA